MFKILIGQAAVGGTTAQQEMSVKNAANDLESQLNDKDNGVISVGGLFIHDLNPMHIEIIAVVETASIKKKGE